MLLKRNCKVCDKEFDAIKSTQFFCCRKCFKKDYYKREKARNAEIRSRFPIYKCPICRHPHGLTFDPFKHKQAYDDLICPFCGIPRMAAFENRENRYFYSGNSMTVQYVIQSAIISALTR